MYVMNDTIIEGLLFLLVEHGLDISSCGFCTLRKHIRRLLDAGVVNFGNAQVD